MAAQAQKKNTEVFDRLSGGEHSVLWMQSEGS
jgi:hypothetical protein